MADQRLADLWREAASGAAEVDERPFDPFAANVLLSAADSLKLAGLEAMGAPVMRRLTSPSRDDPDGERARQRRTDFMILDLLARQQRWDAQLVTVGGVQMTNAEKLAASRRILDEPEQYARWAKMQGLIKEGEEAAFIDMVGRMHKLEELDRKGRLDSEGKRKLNEMGETALGRARNAAIGQAHLDKGRQLTATAAHAETTANPTAGYAGRSAMFAAGSDRILPGDEPNYARREPVTPCFNACALGTELPDAAPNTPARDEISKPANTLAATGLDL